MLSKIKIGVVGLGYVGLPIAIAFAKKFPDTIGFDIDTTKITELKSGIDRTGEISKAELEEASITFTSDPELLKGVNFYVMCIPTPVDQDHRPDLTALESASKIVGATLTPGAVVVYESTVYPGLTEEFCAPILQQHSGLKRGEDFFIGYSPERINPGDREHSVDKIVKVVSAENEDTLKLVAAVYSSITSAGVFEAASIKVAEAAKVIENTQRDLNIALMNELAMIFDRLNIPTRDVLAAAKTKWNFLGFSPGLVGGHCIGVDPYYLTTRAEQVGYHPEVILSGRRINDNMGRYIANKAIKLALTSATDVKGLKAGILGLTFKENVPDIRNSRIPDIVSELKDFGVNVFVHDPLADRLETEEVYGLTLVDLNHFIDLDILIVAVAHNEYTAMSMASIKERMRRNGVLIDVKSIFNRCDVSSDIIYWSL